MPRTRVKPAPYTPPAGWRSWDRIHLPLSWVKTSTANYDDVQGAVIRKAFNALWKNYTAGLKGKPLRELMVAVNPKWLKAALASEEMKTQQTKTNAGVIIYGLLMREDAAVDVNTLAVEEKIGG